MAYRFNPIGPNSPIEDIVKAINANFASLDGEAVAKTFNGPTGNPSFSQGKLKNGFYGIAFLDNNGNTLKLTGFDQSGTFIDITVKDGQDAYTVLGY